MNCKECGQSTTNPKFCSKHCAGAYLGRSAVESGRLALSREHPKFKEAQRDQGRKNVESGQIDTIWYLPQTKAAQRETGRKAAESGRLAQISNLPQTKAAQRESGRKNVESGHLARIGKLPQSIIARRENMRKVGLKYGHANGLKQGQENVRSGQITKVIKAAGSARPTSPERVFYGLVFGNPIIGRGFTAQQSDGHGIYDGAWLDQKIIAELDGDGHHAFKDRHAEDTQKDIARMLDHNTVLRETDENVLFLKALAILSL